MDIRNASFLHTKRVVLGCLSFAPLHTEKYHEYSSLSIAIHISHHLIGAA
jgi:hypothetical protein